MELKQLQYFLAVSSCNSFTRAAENQHVTQQALSKSILKLEQELGVALFDRSVQGISLTEYGASVCPYVQKTMRDVDAIYMAIEEMKHHRSYAIRMGYVLGAFHARSAVTPEDISQWEQMQDRASVFVQEASPGELKKMILSEDLDLAYIIQAEDEFSNQLQCTFLGEEPVCILSAQGTLAEAADFPALYELPVLIGRIGEDPSADLALWFRAAGYLPRIKYYNGPFNQIAERVRMGEGVLIGGESLCRSLAHDGLSISRFPDPSATMKHYLVWKKDKQQPDYVKSLISYVSQQKKA